ncbi:hypothetical protein B0H13DRAFT_2307869 [Mycena leptocephala]|nr:hypothetical protein B0H13DRAFT_2307869 [Mycena leptocephala]
MLGGIIQMGMVFRTLPYLALRPQLEVTLSIYILLASEFFLRYSTDRPLGGRAAGYHPLNSNTSHDRVQLNPQLRIMIGTLAFNTTCLLIRSYWLPYLAFTPPSFPAPDPDGGNITLDRSVNPLFYEDD